MLGEPLTPRGVYPRFAAAWPCLPDLKMALEFNEQTKQHVDRILSRYPNKQAALIPVLHVCQEEFGHLSEEVVDLVSRTLTVPHAHIHGVVTFYTMLHEKKVGRHELMVCTNISCMLKGGYDILEHLEKRLGIKRGETTDDGGFTLIEEECLAACANAPMMICGSEYFLDLTPQKVDEILVRLGTVGSDSGSARPRRATPIPRKA